MKIADSYVSMMASTDYSKSSTLNSSVITKYNGQGFVNSSVVETSVDSYETSHKISEATFATSSDMALLRENKDVYTHSEEKPAKQDEQPKFQSFGNHIRTLESATDNILDGVSDSPKLASLKKMLAMLEKFSGKRFNNMKKLSQTTNSMKSINLTANEFMSMSASSIKINVNSNQPLQQTDSAAQNGYWTRQTVTSGSVQGSENMAFSTTGTAKTEDGREINFNVTMEMTRSFASAFVTTGKEEEFTMTDPLVINLKGNTAGVSDMHFLFDLNNDGKEENISALESGSAFLALDKNNDGEINNGGELFGAKTGNGFAELAEYDQDGNGWIDENDDVFESLSIWTVNADGSKELTAISKAGIGAIFLGSSESDFTLTDSMGNEAAQIRKTGMFLFENGSAGTVQHIDFKA